MRPYFRTCYFIMDNVWMFWNAGWRSLGSLTDGGGREEEGSLGGRVFMSKVTEMEFSPGC